MKNLAAFWCFPLVAVLGCSSDPASDDGAAGAIASAGQAGAALGGNPGSSGSPGASGSPGTSGRPSTGGQPGTGGASGTVAGAPGVSGAGTGGKSGSSIGGTGTGGTSAASGGVSSGVGGSVAGGAGGGSAGGVTGGSGAGGSTAGGSGAAGMGSAAIQTYTSTCASCHGARGEGVAMLGPELQHPVRDYATWVVRNGRMGHPSYPNSVMAPFNEMVLPTAALNEIFDWLSAPALPKPTTGEGLYKDFCATCHGATGVGGTAGHDAKGEPLSKAISMVRSGHSLMQFSSRTGYMPKWSATELTDAEVGLIVDYLDSL